MAGSEEPDKKTSPVVSFVTDFKNIVLAVIAIAAAFSTWQNQKISNDVKNRLDLANLDKIKVENLCNEVRLQIDQKKFSNEQLFQLYREIKDAVNQRNCDQQMLLTMIVDQVLADNISLRDSLHTFIVKKDPSCTAAKYIESHSCPN